MLIAIVLIAIIFRFAAFNQVPPGLHYDEAIDAKLAQEIRSGAWPIYFEEGWGREPLYHYLVAFTLNLIPDPTSALRLVSGVWVSFNCWRPISCSANCSACRRR